MNASESNSTQQGSAGAGQLALGTAQFGSDYGITNTEGQVPQREIARVLDAAANAGVTWIDTASTYGTSEEVLGKCEVGDGRFQIITKTLPLRRPAILPFDVSNVVAAFNRSLERMRCSKVDALLVHHADDLLVPGGQQLFKALEELRDNGTVGKLGVSVYSPQQGAEVVRRFPVEIVQAPLNVLDQRFVATGQVKALAQRGIEVHTRSAYLQGALLVGSDQIPAELAGYRSRLQAFHELRETAGLSAVQAAIAFPAIQPGVTRVVVGATSLREFEQTLEAIHNVRYVAGSMDYSSLACHDERLVNPSLWKRAA